MVRVFVLIVIIIIISSSSSSSIERKRRVSDFERDTKDQTFAFVANENATETTRKKKRSLARPRVFSFFSFRLLRQSASFSRGKTTTRKTPQYRDTKTSSSSSFENDTTYERL